MTSSTVIVARRFLSALLCLLLLTGTASADDEEKGDAPKTPPAAAKDADREAALARAAELERPMGKLYQQRKYRELVALARQVLEIREKVLGSEAAGIVQSLHNLGIFLKEAGEHEEARAVLERAVSIAEKASAHEDTDLSYLLEGLAVVHRKRGAYGEARKLLKRAVTMREAALGRDDPEVARGLNHLALVLYDLGAHDEARARSERALAIREKALGPDHTDVGQSLNNLGMIRRAQGALGEAFRLYSRALAIRERAVGRDHPSVASSVHGLALLLRELSLYEKALAHHERAMAIWAKAFGPDHYQVSSSLLGMASVLKAKGAYSQARVLLERALTIRQKALGLDHVKLAPVLNNLGHLLRSQGNDAEAAALYERALKLQEAARGPEHPEVSVALSNLALARSGEGRHEEARRLAERALEIHVQAMGPDHPRVAGRLLNLATVLVDGGARAEALPLIERALAIRERVLGQDHPDVALTLNNLAYVLAAQGAYAQARRRFNRALAIYEKVFGAEHLEVATVLSNLALLYEADGHLEKARPLLARCLDIKATHIRRSLVGLARPQRLALDRSLRMYLDRWLDLEGQLGNSGYAEVLRFKGSLARASALERRIARSGDGMPEDAILALRAAERRLAALASSAPPPGNPEDGAAWREAYAAAAADREARALELQRTCEPLRRGLTRLKLGLDDIQAALDEETVLLDFLRTGSAYVAWVVPAKGPPIRVDLGAAEPIEAAVDWFLKAVARPGNPAWRPSGRALRKLLLDPLARHLDKHVKHLVVCPDAALASVPFAALPGASQDRFLLDDYLLTSIAMAQDLVPAKEPHRPGNGVLLVGGVDYGEASSGGDEPAAKKEIVARAPAGVDFDFLPGTRAEIETIAALFGDDAQAVLGSEATETRVRSASVGKRVLHLATHGFARDDLMQRAEIGVTDEAKWFGADLERQLARRPDPMVLAGLALAGANPRVGGRGEDGILTALEASHLDLRGVELVVLSACQTATGRAESGAGVVGLVQGFQMGGAGRVVGSLWQVDDQATKALMVRFYRTWNDPAGPGGLPAAEALRAAQQSIRSMAGAASPKGERRGGRGMLKRSSDRGRSEHPWAHPYYWAAWVVWTTRD